MPPRLGLGTFGARGARARRASVDLPVANGHRNLVAFPEKRPLIVLTTRPPQLETPFEVFNDGLITPNDAFFVRYHNAGIPTSIDGDKHVIKIGGNAAGKPLRADAWPTCARSSSRSNSWPSTSARATAARCSTRA